MTAKIQNIKDLDSIKKSFAKKIESFRYTLQLCAGTGCMSSKCLEVRDALLIELEKNNLTSQVRLITTGCRGACALGPSLIVQPEGVFYCKLKSSNVADIVRKHLVEKAIQKEYCYKDTDSGEIIPLVKDIEFFKRQEKIVLKNCGVIDYADIEEFIAGDGYYGLAKALTMDPMQ